MTASREQSRPVLLRRGPRPKRGRRILGQRRAGFAQIIGVYDGSRGISAEVRRRVEAGVRLTLSHKNAPDGQTAYEKEGWREYYFEPMKAYFERRRAAGKS
jgi:hypothetical protein